MHHESHWRHEQCDFASGQPFLDLLAKSFEATRGCEVCAGFHAGMWVNSETGWFQAQAEKGVVN